MDVAWLCCLATLVVCHNCYVNDLKSAATVAQQLAQPDCDGQRHCFATRQLIHAGVTNLVWGAVPDRSVTPPAGICVVCQQL